MDELEEVSMDTHLAGEAAVEVEILGDNPELMEMPDVIREHVLDLLWPCFIGLHNGHLTTKNVVVDPGDTRLTRVKVRHDGDRIATATATVTGQGSPELVMI